MSPETELVYEQQVVLTQPQDEQQEVQEYCEDPSEYAEPLSCELKLGAVALCASCPLLRLFGDCPKALSAPAEFFELDTIALQEPSFIYEDAVDAGYQELPLESTVKEPVLEEMPRVDKQAYYRQQIFDDTVKVVSVWEPKTAIPKPTRSLADAENPLPQPKTLARAQPSPQIKPTPALKELELQEVSVPFTPISVPVLTPALDLAPEVLQPKVPEAIKEVVLIETVPVENSVLCVQNIATLEIVEHKKEHALVAELSEKYTPSKIVQQKEILEIVTPTDCSEIIPEKPVAVEIHPVEVRIDIPVRALDELIGDEDIMLELVLDQVRYASRYVQNAENNNGLLQYGNTLSFDTQEYIHSMPNSSVKRAALRAVYLLFGSVALANFIRYV